MPTSRLTGKQGVMNHAPTRTPISLVNILHHAHQQIDRQTGRDSSRPYENTDFAGEYPSSCHASRLTGKQGVMNHAPTRTPISLAHILRHATRAD
jgi:hypothetical protein